MGALVYPGFGGMWLAHCQGAGRVGGGEKYPLTLFFAGGFSGALRTCGTWCDFFRRPGGEVTAQVPWTSTSTQMHSRQVMHHVPGNRLGLPNPSDFCPHRVWAYSLVCFGFCCYCPSDSAKFPVVSPPFARATILLVTPWYFPGVFSLAKFPFGHVAVLLVTSWYFQTYFRLVPAPEAVWARRTPGRRNETLPRNTTTSG